MNGIIDIKGIKLNSKYRTLLFDIIRILITIVIALFIGFIITLMVSHEPIEAYKAFLFGPLSRLNRFGNWIEDSTTLILVGLSVAVVFKAEQFSLGAEGQIYLGALIAGMVSLYLGSPVRYFWGGVEVPVTSPYLPFPQVAIIGIALIAAAVAGFLWGLVPGVLKAYLGADEIVSTLMLNTIAIRIYEWLLNYWIKPPTAGQTASDVFPEAGRLPVVIPGTRVTIALFLAIIAIGAVYFLMYRTPLGYEIRMVGANIKFARYGGIDSKKVIALSMALSGVLAGIAGATLSMGMHKQLILNISVGIGFEGIVVALLARNNPLAVPFTGLFYGYLRTGAQIMERQSDVSREMVLVIQGIIILLITAEYIWPIIQKRFFPQRRPTNVT